MPTIRALFRKRSIVSTAESLMGASLRFGFQFFFQILRKFVDVRMLAELKRANIGNDRPAVGYRHLFGIALHHTKTVRDDIEEIPNRSVAQSINVERWGRLESSSYNHAVTRSKLIVAWS